ncbi:hypothetical protein ACFXDH_23265 [Streptomyces sp. NPDC059467]|uniref:hypothetical protein n=1 Tax=Streptomyces sp. NPDC059467 TaxID=3346844 RepID=UPI0036ABF1F7
MTFPFGRRLWTLMGAGAAVVAVLTGALVWQQGRGTGTRAPEPVSHVDTATRACLLTSTDVDPAGTWAALRKMAASSHENVVAQRYRLPAGVDSVAYVNTLVQLRCSTIVTTGTAARSAVASRLAVGPVAHIRLVVVADQPLPGATHLSPNAVSARALSRLVTG